VLTPPPPAPRSLFRDPAVRVPPRNRGP
jgi:hypothetical protein